MFEHERKKVALFGCQTSTLIRKAVRVHADAGAKARLDFLGEINILAQFLI